MLNLMDMICIGTVKARDVSSGSIDSGLDNEHRSLRTPKRWVANIFADSGIPC